MAPFLLLLLAALSSSPHLATAVCVRRNTSASAQADASPTQLPSPAANPPPAMPPTSTDSPASITPPATPPTSADSPASITPPATPPTSTDSPASLTPPATPSPPSPVTDSPPVPLDDSTGHIPLPSLATALKIIISGLCRKTDYPDVCLLSILPLAHTAGGEVDAGVMLRLQMKACRTKIGQAQKQVTMLMRKLGMDERTASNLQLCSDSYDDALDNLEEAESALESKDRGTINSMLSALIDDFGTCDDGFAEMHSHSLLSIIDGVLSKMASNCLVFASLNKDLH